MKKIKQRIEFYKQYLLKDNSRNRDDTVDPWEVYGLHHAGKFNFSAIARKLSGETGNPSENKNLMAIFKQVNRAYNKAVQMIKQVEQETKING